MAALLFAVGSVVEQRAAQQAPPQDTLSLRLLWFLVRQRLWLAGLVVSLVGNLVAAVALGRGGVALVQPLFTVRLLFALPLAARLARVRVAGRDWGGALATALGLAAFVVAGQPGKGTALDAPSLSWAITGGTIVAVVAGLVTWARRLDAAREATLLGAGAGVLFGLQSALTEVAVSRLTDDGLVAMLTSWQPYAVVVTALSGAVLIQSAYEMAPLTASFPALVTTEPLTGLAIGVGVLGGSLRLGAIPLAAEIIGLAVMVGGVYLLATSPIVTGQLDLLQRRRDEGLAYRTATELEALLRELQDDVDRLADDTTRPDSRAHRSVTEGYARAERSMQRLEKLRADMVRHRADERDHVDSRPSKEQLALKPLERELDEREQEIEQWRQRLAARLESLPDKPEPPGRD